MITRINKNIRGMHEVMFNFLFRNKDTVHFPKHMKFTLATTSKAYIKNIGKLIAITVISTRQLNLFNTRLGNTKNRF